MNISKIVEEIKQGNLVITPTDTIYGIMADANNIDAVRKVFESKNRSNKPLLLIVDSIDMLLEYTQNLSSLEKEIIEKYFPGKLTMLLHKNDKVSDEITCGSELVGIRIPDNKDLIEIIRRVGNPLISTSANISGQKSITNPKEIEPELLKYISYVEDKGTINSEPSSLIKVVDNEIVVLREGSVARKILNDYAAVLFKEN